MFPMEGTFCVLDEAFWPCNWPPAWLFMPCGLLVGVAADLVAVAEGGEVVDVLPESLLWVLLNVDSGSAKRALCLEVVWVRGEPVFLSAVGDVGESSLVRFFFKNPNVGIEPSSLLRRFRGSREAEDTTVGGGGWTVWACRGMLDEAISQGRARVRERGRLPSGDQTLIDRCFYLILSRGSLCQTWCTIYPARSCRVVRGASASAPGSCAMFLGALARCLVYPSEGWSAAQALSSGVHVPMAW